MQSPPDRPHEIVLSTITDFAWLVDLDGRLLFANRALLELWARGLDDVLGKTFRGLGFEPSVCLGLERDHREVLQTRKPVDGDMPYTSPAGRAGHYEYTLSPVLSRDGVVEAVAGSARDVTRRKAAAAAISDKLERQSRLFEQIATSTPDFIYVFDLDARFLYANRRLLEVWGVTYEQAVGKGLSELGYPDWHAAMHHRELAQVKATKKPIRGEVPFTGGSGIAGIYEYIFTPVLGPDGEVEVIVGTTRDVTDRRKLDDRMERDGMLLSNVRDSVIVTDLQGIVTYWNEGATRLFGWTAEELLGRPLTDRLPFEARAEVEEWIRKIGDGRAEFDGEWLDVRKDGSRVWIECTTRRITDPTNRAPGIMGVARDITARKAIAAERDQLLASERAARGEAERASRMKDEFLATLSHELRTPLNAILGWATILAGRAEGDASLRGGLETIERNARAQTHIIEDLLDMSRIISGKVRLEVQVTDLASVLQTAVDSVRPTAESKGVKLRAILDPEAGPVMGDANRLQQVFWNLLVNAVKFTPKGGHIEVVLGRIDSHLEVSVADTGEGIGADFLPFVFDRFRQADASTSRQHGGLGLGLAIVKQLVELHGGRVRVASAGAGKGSVFTLELPTAIVRAPAFSEPISRRHPTASHDAEPQATGDEPDLTGVNVVAVDDEPDARALVQRLLEDRGAKVRSAASAAEAIDLIVGSPPDVLISDIGMPGEDGYAFIRRVRSLAAREGGDVPAVALTAYARTEDRVRAIRAGYQSHLVKPVDARELVAVVSSLGRRVTPV